MTEQKLRTLFPPLAPFASGDLKVSDGHEIHFEQSGNRHGQAVLFLHGGPGSGSNPDHRRLFDPQRYHIIQFDQRGCGKSTPHGSLEANMTAHLVEDTGQLLTRLGVEAAHLAGGSWGSTLALAFAMSQPERVISLLLYGIFLCRPREFQSLYFKGGVVSQLYPEVFDPFIELLPVYDRDDPIRGYWKLFHSDDNKVRTQALYMWTLLEQHASKLIVDEQRLQEEMSNFDYVLSHSLIENHYFQNDGFIDGDQILRDARHQLRDIPVHIINGRYDLVCPMITAFELHKALPGSKMTIVPDAGHSFREPGLTDAIIRAANDLAGV